MGDDNFKIDVDFIDNVAHQLIAPLQTIEAHCRDIAEGIVGPDEAPRRLKEVIGHVRMVTQLAQRIKFLHQLITLGGKFDDIGRETVAFSSIVTQFIDSYNNYLPLLRVKKLTVEMDTERMNALPYVFSWPVAVQQVVMNLFDNAAKYCRNGGKIRITAKRHGGFVQASFATKSLPIPLEDAERIFERGYRSEASRQVKAGGTGVGLWISRQLMTAMGGSLSCEPGTNGEANVFHISWRVANEGARSRR